MFCLPLSAFCPCDRAVYIAEFTARHGKLPNEESTWAEWCAVAKRVDERMWLVALYLPRAYPQHTDAFQRVVVELAWRAATHVFLSFIGSDLQKQRLQEVLNSVRLWLDGAAIDEIELHRVGAENMDGADTDNIIAAACDLAFAAGSAQCARRDNACYGDNVACRANVAINAANVQWKQQQADLDALLAQVFC